MYIYKRIKSYGDLKFFLKEDFRANGVVLSIKNIIKEPNLKFIFYMRIYEYFINTDKPYILILLIKIIYRRHSIRVGFHVAPNIFGKGLAIVHHGLLIINRTTRFGDYCRIHMGVHIGAQATFKIEKPLDEYTPKFGDYIYIGPGAKIYGAINIGSDCIIGTNSVVNKSFENGKCVLVGSPAKKIRDIAENDLVIR